MRAAIYNIKTKEIDRFVICPAFSLIIQCQAGEEFYLNCPPEATHIIDNLPVTVVIPPTETEIIANLTQAIQQHLDTTARTRNYDGILSLCSYTTSLDLIFSAEGQAGAVWRDACWRYSYQVITDVQAQLRTIPTPVELVAELPGIIWP